MAIKIGNLIRERREGVALLRVEEDGKVRIEETRISFLKPTETLYREFKAIEAAQADDDKTTIVAMLLKVDLQSPDIINEDGTVHRITESDLLALGIEQLIDFRDGVQSYFFLQTPPSESETDTKSISAQASTAA